jgi:hypothetical protein
MALETKLNPVKNTDQSLHLLNGIAGNSDLLRYSDEEKQIAFDCLKKINKLFALLSSERKG